MEGIMNFSRMYIRIFPWTNLQGIFPATAHQGFSFDSGFLGVRFYYDFQSNAIQESKERKDFSNRLMGGGWSSIFSDRLQTSTISTGYHLSQFDFEEAAGRISQLRGTLSGRINPSSIDVLAEYARQARISDLVGDWLGGPAEIERSALFRATSRRYRQAIHEEAEGNRRSESAKKFLETGIGKVLCDNGWGDILSRDASTEDIRPSTAFSEYQARRREQARLSHLRRGRY